MRPNRTRIIQRPPKKTFVVYQDEMLGRPNESIADKRNKASNAASPRSRLEKDVPLLRPPLKIDY